MKKKQRMISVILSLVFVLSIIVMPGEKVNAAGAYSAYVPTGSEASLDDKEVKFNGCSWYLIADNSTAANAGTVTLLMDGFVYEKCVYSLDGKDYNGSIVETQLGKQMNGSFAGVADAMVAVDLTDVGVPGAKLWLLSETEASALSLNVRDAIYDGWLRTCADGKEKIPGLIIYVLHVS